VDYCCALPGQRPPSHKTRCMRRTQLPPTKSSGAFISAGAELALPEGNPTGATGTYALRPKMPDNYKIAPHWHRKRENHPAEFAADIPDSRGPRLFCSGN
jgi:hypothetical protein